MELEDLPQPMIDSFLNYQKKSLDVESKWNTENKYEDVQMAVAPYFRYLIKDEKYVYKIFYDNMVHPKIRKYRIIETFNIAVNKGFFEDIAIIEKFISYRNQFIGYVIPICETVENNFRMKRTLSQMSDLIYQPEEFQKLYSKLKENVIKTNIAYTDLMPNNIIQFENKYYLIDLDSLVNLEKINVNTFHSRYGTLPYFYNKFIYGLLYRQNFKTERRKRTTKD